MMYRRLSFLTLCMYCVVSPLACTRSDQAELANARAEAEVSKAEAAKARAEVEDLRARSVGGTAKLPPASPAAGNGAVPTGLASGGIAVFPDGKERQFTTLTGLQRGSAGGVAITGLAVPGTSSQQVKYLSFGGAEKGALTIPVHQIAQLKFEEPTKEDYDAFYETHRKLQPTYPLFVEITSITGPKDRFRYDRVDLIVTWADGLGETSFSAGPINYEAAVKAESELFKGMTFRAGPETVGSSPEGK